MAECNVSTLLAAANAFSGLSAGQLQAIIAQLLCEISENGTGGGGAQELYTGAAPPAAPDDPTKPALFYPHGGGPMFQWDVPTQQWV